MPFEETWLTRSLNCLAHKVESPFFPFSMKLSNFSHHYDRACESFQAYRSCNLVDSVGATILSNCLIR